MKRLQIAVFTFLVLFLVFGFQNCGDVHLLGAVHNASSAVVPPDPTIPQVTSVLTPPAPPTYTQDACAQYISTNPICYQSDADCNRKVQLCVNSSKNYDLVVSPDTWVDVFDFTPNIVGYSGTRTLNSKLRANVWSEDGLEISESHWVRSPSVEKTVKFGFQFVSVDNGDASPMSTVTLTVKKYSADQNNNCAGYRKTTFIDTTKYKGYETFTGSHALFPDDTAIVVKFRANSPASIGRISIGKPYYEGLGHYITISTQPCDFTNNRGITYFSSSPERDFYQTQGVKFDSDRDYYINMDYKHPLPGVTLHCENPRANCWMIVSISQQGLIMQTGDITYREFTGLKAQLQSDGSYLRLQEDFPGYSEMMGALNAGQPWPGEKPAQ